MSDKTKKIIRTGGLIAVAVGTVAVCSIGGSAKDVAGLVTLTGAAVTAVGAVILAIIGK